MTLDERLHFCVNCKNKRVDFKQGLVCDITGFPPAFDGECPSYTPIKSDVDRPILKSKRSTLDHYRPNKDRANYAIAMLVFILFLDVIQMFLTWSKVTELQGLNFGQQFTQELIDNANSDLQMYSYFQTLIFICTAIVFLNWFRRAYFNLQSRVPDLKYSDSYAVWAWFIPIVNFYQPYQIAKELWIKTKTLLNTANAKKYADSEDVIINIWWFFWVFQDVIVKVLWFTTRELASIQELITVYKYDTYVIPLEIIAALCAIELVRKFSKMEEAVAVQITNNTMPNNLDDIKGI
jgi:hypothetical protein